MSEYIGQVGSKISLEVTFKKTFSYQTHYTYYGEWHNIHTFEDADGNCIIWNTSSFVYDKKVLDKNECPAVIYEGSKLLLKGTVKEHSEYKGTKQTAVNRPTFKLLELAKSPEELQQEKEAAKEAKRQMQEDSLQGNDFLWEMPYKQYKERYSDCETLEGSFDAHTNSRGERTAPATITVIIREGRLKNSGVRGEHFSGYQMTNEEGKWITYRAVSEENALKRVQKEFPEHQWKCTKIYDYRRNASAWEY